MQITKGTGYNWKFLAGTTISFLFSAVIGVFNFGILYYLGTPALGLGLGLLMVLRSSTNNWRKAIVSLLCLPIFFVSFFLSFYFHSAEAETFLIPRDYRGPMTVFLHEECGSEPEWEGGRRIYRIGVDGVAITQVKMNDGFLNRKFFLVDSEGDREEIPQFSRQNFETEEREWDEMQAGRFAAVTKETVGIFHRYGATTYYTSEHSINLQVGDYRYWDTDEKVRWSEIQSWESSAVSALMQCRSVTVKSSLASESIDR